MWWLYVPCSYFLQLVLFTLLGYGLSCFGFSKSAQWNKRLIWAPMLGVCSLMLTTSYFMLAWLPGHSAAWAGFCTSAALSFLFYLGYRKARGRAARVFVWQPFLPAIAGALIFLAPLILTNNHGFFALNGGDFGSYGGWADYFQNKPLVGGPVETPANFTLSHFLAIQKEVATPDKGFRIGNITYFSAIKAILPGDFSTAYECTIALALTMVILSVYLFCCCCLRVRHRAALAVACTFIVCNTVAWLACAHFVPNVMAIALMMSFLAVVCAIFRRQSKPQFLVAAFIVSGIILMYPEISPIAAIMLVSHCLTMYWRQPQKILRCLALCLTAVALGAAISTPFVAYAYNWIWQLIKMHPSGDTVGIFEWAYPCQYFGLIDYDYVLKGEGFHRAPYVTLLATSLAAALFLLHARQSMRRPPLLGLLVGIIIFTMPIGKYFLAGNTFFAFRACVIVSAFVFVALMSLSIDSLFWLWRRFQRKLWRKISISTEIFRAVSAVCLVVLLATLAYVRLSMNTRIIRGTPHARIFGNDYLKIGQVVADSVRKINPDYLFVNYVGTGTTEASWHWLFQRFPYIFPISGEGCNTFQTQFLENKKVLVLDFGAPAVASIEGSTTSALPLCRVGTFAIFDATKSDLIIPFSSAWVSGQSPLCETLMGVPGQFLLWSTRDRSATIGVKVRNLERKCALTINFSDGSEAKLNLGTGGQPELDALLNVHVKQGLNVLTFAAELDSSEFADRQKFIETVRSNKDASENDKQLALLASGKLPPVDPRGSSTSVKGADTWLMVRPPNQKGFVPYVDILSVKVSLQR